jgi:hypothetical protein
VEGPTWTCSGLGTTLLTRRYASARGHEPVPRSTAAYHVQKTRMPATSYQCVHAACLPFRGEIVFLIKNSYESR